MYDKIHRIVVYSTATAGGYDITTWDNKKAVLQKILDDAESMGITGYGLLNNSDETACKIVYDAENKDASNFYDYGGFYVFKNGYAFNITVPGNGTGSYREMYPEGTTPLYIDYAFSETGFVIRAYRPTDSTPPFFMYYLKGKDLATNEDFHYTFYCSNTDLDPEFTIEINGSYISKVYKGNYVTQNDVTPLSAMNLPNGLGGYAAPISDDTFYMALTGSSCTLAPYYVTASDGNTYLYCGNFPRFYLKLADAPSTAS